MSDFAADFKEAWITNVLFRYNDEDKTIYITAVTPGSQLTVENCVFVNCTDSPIRLHFGENVEKGK